MKRLVLPLAACLLALLSLIWQDFYNEPLELSTYDLRQRLTQRPASTEVVIGSIDEESSQVLGPWPWPREAHALLLESLYSQQAKAVFLDLMLEEAKPGDVQLARSLRAGFSVLGGRLDRVESEGYQGLQMIPPAPALRGAAEVGLLHRLDDQGGGVRMGLIAIALNSARADSRPMLAPAFQLYLHSLGADPAEAEFSVDSLPLSSALPNVSHMSEGEHPAEVRVGAQAIPLVAFVRQRDNAIVFTLPARYHQAQTGPGASGPSVVSYVKLPEAKIQGRYVMVGENGNSDIDLVVTPLGRMKGVEVHAQTFQSLADGNYLRLIGWSRWLLLALSLGFAVVLSLTHTARSTLLVLLAYGAAYAALNVALFACGWWLPLATPLLIMAISAVLLFFFRLAVARSAFAELAAPEAAAQMLISDKGEQLEAETVDAVVVVTDIRGYTTLSETRTAVQMLDLLNEYHTATVAVYKRYGGRALTYQGDAQLVVFGYPKRLKDPGSAAVKACVDLQEVCTKLRLRWGVPEESFSVGAAVCSGRLVIGRLGAAESQIQYTVIGEAVRRAHKIQSMSDKLASPVLVDAETVKTMKSTDWLEDLGPVEVDGMPGLVPLQRPRPRS